MKRYYLPLTLIFTVISLTLFAVACGGDKSKPSEDINPNNVSGSLVSVSGGPVIISSGDMDELLDNADENVLHTQKIGELLNAHYVSPALSFKKYNWIVKQFACDMSAKSKIINAVSKRRFTPMYPRVDSSSLPWESPCVDVGRSSISINELCGVADSIITLSKLYMMEAIPRLDALNRLRSSGSNVDQTIYDRNKIMLANVRDIHAAVTTYEKRMDCPLSR